MTAEGNEDGTHRAPLQRPNVMSKLGQVVEAVEKYNRFVIDQVKRAWSDEQYAR